MSPRITTVGWVVQEPRIRCHTASIELAERLWGQGQQRRLPLCLLSFFFNTQGYLVAIFPNVTSLGVSVIYSWDRDGDTWRATRKGTIY